MKVIVVHPGKQHSYHTATALKQDGILEKYITSVYNKPGTLTRLLSKFLPTKYKSKLSNKKIDTLQNDDVMVCCEFLGICNIFLNHLPFFRKYWPSFNAFLNKHFAIKVAKYAILHNVDAVISYDNNSDILFEILKEKAPKIRRIMDVSFSNRLFLLERYEYDMAQTGDRGIYNEQQSIWDPKNQKKLKREIDLTDNFIVASNAVKRSLMYSGVKEQQIVIIPYGVNLKTFENIIDVSQKNVNKPLRCIYVGQIRYYKGLHHLLKIVKELGAECVELVLAGDYDTNSPLYVNYKDCANIHFIGFVTHSELSEEYSKSDVFVFPTLGEGYGLVVLESLGCGIPVICSDLAGGNDAIVEGKNGFVFPAGDDNKLKDLLIYCAENKQILSSMRDFCEQSVQNLTWEKYYCSVADYIRKILLNGGNR